MHTSRQSKNILSQPREILDMRARANLTGMLSIGAFLLMTVNVCAVTLRDEPQPTAKDAADGKPIPAQKAAGQPTEQPAPALEQAADEKPRNQYWFAGTSNYHLLLHESEQRITKQMDRPFGLLFPDWKRPTTFRNWSDDFMLWDLWGGYGLDISKKLCWSIYGGGGAGEVPNGRTYYPLGLPVKFKADFMRVSLMAGTSVTWYPFGKPEKVPGGLLQDLKSARPMAEMNIGYTHQISIGDVKLSLPIVGRVVRVRQSDQYDLLWASPRLGVEMPLTKTNSLNILGGYLFMDKHSTEYNGALLEFFIRHRF
jgi:hypothetical protein